MLSRKLSAVSLAAVLATSAFSSSATEIPLMIPFSGNVSVDTEAFEGKGNFKFAIISKECVIASERDQCSTLWSNDDSSERGNEPSTGVIIHVNSGRFQLKLGDTSYTNMNPIPETVFSESETYLRLWFDDGVNGYQQLRNDRQLISAPYAYRAMKADKLGELAVDAMSIKPGVVSGIHINTDEVQARIHDSCSEGSTIRQINADGSVECTSAGNQFSAGHGISIENNEISILPTSISVDNLSTSESITIESGVVEIKTASISREHLSFNVVDQTDLQTVANATVPVGGIIDWWRPNENYQPPEGFQVCDGAMITDERSPYVNTNTPDLTNRFTMGVSLESLGNTGGSAFHSHHTDIDHGHTATSALAGTHNHSGTTSRNGAHNHGYNINHNHGRITSSSNTHQHDVLNWDSATKDWTDASGTIITNWDNGTDSAGSGVYSLAGQGTVSIDINTAPHSHNHTADIPNYVEAQQFPNDPKDNSTRLTETFGNHEHDVNTSNAGEHRHDVAVQNYTSDIKRESSQSSSLPPFVGMLKLMRIY